MRTAFLICLWLCWLAPEALSQSHIPYVCVEDSVALRVYMAPNLDPPFTVVTDISIAIHGEELVTTESIEYFIDTDGIFTIEYPKTVVQLQDSNVSHIMINLVVYKKGEVYDTDRLRYENSRYRKLDSGMAE